MKRDTAHDHREIDFSDAIGLQFQDDSPEEANPAKALPSNSSPDRKSTRLNSSHTSVLA
jgi:hypothetical protein